LADVSERRSKAADGAPGTAPVQDHRAVRVTLAPALAHAALPALVVGPSPGDPGEVVIDGQPTMARLSLHGEGRATLVVAEREAGDPSDPSGPPRTGPFSTSRILVEAPEDRADGSGVRRREVVVDGWRFELDIESERRASLRERAGSGRADAAHGGPIDVRAIIPGRVVSVSVETGEAVVAGQQVLVVEAMKMQNELRAPRDGVVARVAVAAGQTIEIGDLLLVVE